MSARTFAHHRSTVPARHRHERGETLIETVMSVFLIASVVVAMILTLFTVVRSTGTNRKIVRTGNEAVAVAEVVERTPYQSCGASPAPLQYYRNAVTVDLVGYEAEIVTVRHLKDKTAITPPGGESFQDSCPASDQGAQEITVRLSSKRPPIITEELVFYKRADECPLQNREFEGQLC